MILVDTHCHIHWPDYDVPADEALAEASKDGVKKLICVGTDVKDSEIAVEFASQKDNCWASIGIHPHDGKDYVGKHSELDKFAKLADKPKVVAIGETGLDYFYNHSPKRDQFELLHFQLDLAKKHDLPLILHIREAFDDFWPIFDKYSGLKGVLHSFTANTDVLRQGLDRGLYIGLNGIMTFTTKREQLEMARAVPLERLLLETDAPFLTPTPYRGTICEPKHVRVVAEFLAKLKGITLENLAEATTQNVKKLFNI